jgi:hypothetical protein
VAASLTKPCPDCAESVAAAARVCKHCGYRFDREHKRDVSSLEMVDEQGHRTTIRKARLGLLIGGTGLGGSLFAPWYDLAFTKDPSVSETSNAFQALKYGDLFLAAVAVVAVLLALLARPKALSPRLSRFAVWLGFAAMVGVLYSVFRWIKIPGGFATSPALKETFGNIAVFHGGRDFGMAAAVFFGSWTFIAAFQLDSLYRKAGEDEKVADFEARGLDALPDEMHRSILEAEQGLEQARNLKAAGDKVAAGEAARRARDHCHKAHGAYTKAGQDIPDLQARFDAFWDEYREVDKGLPAQKWIENTVSAMAKVANRWEDFRYRE